jgi:hypothetical protein
VTSRLSRRADRYVRGLPTRCGRRGNMQFVPLTYFATSLASWTPPQHTHSHTRAIPVTLRTRFVAMVTMEIHEGYEPAVRVPMALQRRKYEELELARRSAKLRMFPSRKPPRPPPRVRSMTLRLPATKLRILHRAFVFLVAVTTNSPCSPVSQSVSQYVLVSSTPCGAHDQISLFPFFCRTIALLFVLGHPL